MCNSNASADIALPIAIYDLIFFLLSRLFVSDSVCVCVGSIFLFLSLFFSALVSEDLLCLLLVLLLLSETESVPATSVCVSVRLHSHPLGISG